MKKSSFFSNYISDMDTPIRGYVVRKSCFFSKCISELDTRIRGYADTECRSRVSY